MVKALHKAGIGVILDVVFNHTAEGGMRGPNMNFKGFANEIYYHLNTDDRRIYKDYTGCGNTVNCNHPLVASFVISCLEYWVREMHVDGFRFDLASVLARGEDGRPLKHAPILWNIEFSDVLAHTKVIAEAWDVGGLYQVGDFPGYRWAEWNGRFRDVIRQFVNGEKGIIDEVATRISGSSDLYKSDGKLPINSINYVTCHDGPTLYDLIIQKKSSKEVKREARNYIAILLLSQGVPMILGGDEMLRTQQGNTNAYCQDNEISWYDWQLFDKNHDMVRFVKQMIALRQRHPCLMRTRFLTGRKQNGRRLPDVTWHGTNLRKPLWKEPSACFLAYTLGGISDEEEDIHVILNMSDHEEMVSLPRVPGRTWVLTVNTGHESPGDIRETPDRLAIQNFKYIATPRTVLVFETLPD
jgi:isoamylase